MLYFNDCFVAILIMCVFRSAVKGIERAYIFNDQICIDVEQGRLGELIEQIRKLESYDDYESLLKINECQCGKPFGLFSGGAPITGLTGDAHSIQIIKDNQNIRSFEDIPIPHNAGTVGCFIKDENEFYGLTSQHILAEETANGTRNFFTCLQDVNGITVPGITHVGSIFRGFIGLQGQNVPAKAVDAAIFSLDQLCLDEIQLTKLPMVTIDDILPSCQEHKCYVVEKIGAKTGRTRGVITHTRVPTNLPNNTLGQMFYVAPLSNEPSEIFSDFGDSGSLVTINIRGKEYALGIVQGGGVPYMGFQHVTYCVEVKYCLEALTHGYSAQIMPDLYKGFLKPQDQM